MCKVRILSRGDLNSRASDGGDEGKIRKYPWIFKKVEDDVGLIKVEEAAASFYFFNFCGGPRPQQEKERNELGLFGEDI